MHSHTAKHATSGATALVLVLLVLLAPWRAAAELTPGTLLGALVGVEASVPADARSAGTLGTERQGSGVLIDSDGLVLTIGYLVLEAESVQLTMADGGRMPASVVGYHSETGLGLLRAQGRLAGAPLRLGDSDRATESTHVIVAAFGGHAAIRPALVVARREFAGAWEYLIEDAIYTAPAHPAWAGAALVGEDGRLLGIGYLRVALGEGALLAGNMFVPINHLKPILTDLLADGRTPGPRRPWLGLYSTQVKGRLFVERVAEDGPAAAAGIEPGDIVLGVAGQPVRDMAALYRAVWARGEAGVEVPLTILKDLRPEEVRVRSMDRYDWFRKPGTF